MRPDRGDHPRRVTQRPEVAGRSISGRNFDLSDDSACARRTDDKRRLRLIPLAVVWDSFQQRSTYATKAALRVADWSAGA